MKSNVFLGFLAGAAAGAIAGIMLAPDKGSATRRKLVDQTKKISSDIGDNISEKYSNFKDYVSEMIDSMKGRMTRIEHDVKEQAREAQSQAARAAKGATNL
jgi:gas vesicle protein